MFSQWIRADRTARTGGSRRSCSGHAQGRYLLASALVLALLSAPLAVASGEGDPILGGERNPSPNKSAALTAETQILTQNGTYGTRQSNKMNGDGGGAIYGCRSAPGKEPCVRANNLKNGRAFEWETNGSEGGFIEVGSTSPNANAVPFNTNAAGRVANFNADRVDSLHAEEIVAQARAHTLWAVVEESGTLSRRSGATGSSRMAAGEYEVVFGRDVAGCGYAATLGTADAVEPAGGEVGVAHRSGNKNAVSVVTRASDGIKADRPFHLTVNC